MKISTDTDGTSIICREGFLDIASRKPTLLSKVIQGNPATFRVYRDKAKYPFTTSIERRQPEQANEVAMVLPVEKIPGKLGFLFYPNSFTQ